MKGVWPMRWETDFLPCRRYDSELGCSEMDKSKETTRRVPAGVGLSTIRELIGRAGGTFDVRSMAVKTI